MSAFLRIIWLFRRDGVLCFGFGEGGREVGAEGHGGVAAGEGLGCGVGLGFWGLWGGGRGSGAGDEGVHVWGWVGVLEGCGCEGGFCGARGREWELG